MNDARTASTDAVVCPRCGQRAVPILRGLPTAEAFDAADRGEIVLGGCMVSDADPAFACMGFDCGLQFGR